MMRLLPYTLLLILTLTLSNFSYSKHLVGGDLTYRCLGKNAVGLNQYEISLILYRDCRPTDNRPTNTPFDQTIDIYFFDGGTEVITNIQTLHLADSVFLPLISDDTCVEAPTNLCYLVTTYRDTIELPDNPNGYYLSWGRCCRNESILNILDPGSQGIAFSAYIPNTAFCNSSPTFNNNLPTFVCQNRLFTFDHSAVDPDGDSLVYAISTPYSAGDETIFLPTPTPPPYQQVLFQAPFSLGNAMGGIPPLNIDPQTGQLSVKPDSFGQFVFSVSVYEYRNGVLLSEVKRDLQVNVIDCPINHPPEINVSSADSLRSGDTLFFYRGEQNCFDFDIIDRNGAGVAPDNISMSAEGEIFGGGNVLPPYATFQSTTGLSPLRAGVCWTPNCEANSPGSSMFVLIAQDENDCPAPNITRDTFYIVLRPPRSPPPVLQCVSVTGPNTIDLQWLPLPTEQRGGFQSYYIERNDGSGWQTISIVAQADLDSYTDFTAINAYQQNYCYRLRSTRICPNLLIGEAGNEQCSMITEATSVSPVQSQINWTPHPWGNNLSYTLYANDGATEYIIAENIQDTSFLFTACDFQGRLRAAVVDPQSGCTIYAGYTNEILHQNEPPTTSDICRVLVLENGNIQIDWQISSITDFANYRLYRRKLGEADSTLILTSDSINQQTYIDDINSQQASYCYRLEVIDICGEIAISGEDCSVRLQAINQDFQIEINWSDYLGWDILRSYELWEVADSLQPRLIQTLRPNVNSFTDKEVQPGQGLYCYRIRAIESANGCGSESWSNTACVAFSPQLFIPNAFSPNGDGINDIFRLQGIFINNYYLSIFNRWGQKIFESRELDQGWNGKNSQGRDAPEGVYVYRLRMEGFAGELLERGGTITLIR